jgi:hypothetical protein
LVNVPTDNVENIASWIQAQPGYSPGVPIVLNACFAGVGGKDGSESVAAQLSVKLGVPVAGPSSVISLYGTVGANGDEGWRVFTGGVWGYDPSNIVGF